MERVRDLGRVIMDCWRFGVVAVVVERTRPRKVSVSLCLATVVGTLFLLSQLSISDKEVLCIVVQSTTD